MNRITQIVLPTVASPALLLLLKLLNVFELPPMGQWEFPPAIPAFVTCTVAAMIASALTKQGDVRRVVMYLAAFLLCLYAYNYLLGHLPTTGWLELYHFAAYASFFGTYFCFGVCVALVCDFLTKGSAGKPPVAPPETDPKEPAPEPKASAEKEEEE